jgi:hypothetical protein
MNDREEEFQKRDERVAMYKQQVRDGTHQHPTKKNFSPILHWWLWHLEGDLFPGATGLIRKFRILYFVHSLLYLENIAGALISPSRLISRSRPAGRP